MKTKHLLSLLILSGTFAEASVMDQLNFAMAGPDCIQKMGSTLHALTHPENSDWIEETAAKFLRKTVLKNISNYEVIAQSMQHNLASNISNRQNLRKISAALEANANSALGAPIAGCIRRSLDPLIQNPNAQLINDAIKKLNLFKKAVN